MKSFLKNSTILITGGLGFIGTNLIIKLKKDGYKNIYCLDKYSYSSSYIYSSQKNKLLEKKNIINLDISNKGNVKKAINLSNPDIIFHLAAETHVDRSIESSSKFIESNIVGTYNMLEESKEYWNKLSGQKKEFFKFIHISTDEVFGDLINQESANEESLYNPSSPYSASKASSDLLVKAWNKTYKLPTIITNCSNNYGPWQFPDKLVPLSINKIINSQKIPLYGDGSNIRNWIFVEDHIEALLKCAYYGVPGENYCIGGDDELSNKDLIAILYKIFNKIKPYGNSYPELIEFVKERPGHDCRYSINSRKIKNDFNWNPKYSLGKGMVKTINWYLNNQEWMQNIQKDTNYFGERIGLIR